MLRNKASFKDHKKALLAAKNIGGGGTNQAGQRPAYPPRFEGSDSGRSPAGNGSAGRATGSSTSSGEPAAGRDFRSPGSNGPPAENTLNPVATLNTFCRSYQEMPQSDPIDYESIKSVGK